MPALLFASFAFAVLLQWPIGHTLAQWEQPNTVNYQSFDPYVLYVEDNSSRWNVFNRGRHCRIGVVARVHGNFRYGHWTEYTFHNHQSEPDYFPDCTVTWETEGVTITEPTGHKLFIPKKAFIGGR